MSVYKERYKRYQEWYRDYQQKRDNAHNEFMELLNDDIHSKDKKTFDHWLQLGEDCEYYKNKIEHPRLLCKLYRLLYWYELTVKDKTE